MQEFEEYLTNKKIDAKALRETEPHLWEEWISLFAKVHPNSFSQQKLFLINAVRRRFPLENNAETEQEKTVTQAKPKPKFKIPAKPKKDEDQS
ncbi:hypothetical protein [Catalinimonas niigatensis]|uniref:hypothetical protein n=1 Tax=Catalinimonas niigatensis TaxID=1397264 RepID=UPI00266501B7|nr:hypothetical protein [Catalinimonas niigatensis]WPP49024.1 hypothetical protein PZB72_20360 [Catalinimonas niigatensis]